MRSYGQYCALAKALDLVGDRWSLLIVRELQIRGRCRYVDLLNGLPGIATNLLATRLKELEAAGVVRRQPAQPPVASPLYELTERGRGLEPAIRAFAQWGGQFLGEWNGEEAFCSHWLAMPAQLHLADTAPDEPPVTLEVRTGAEPLTIEAARGTVQARPGPAEAPDAVLSGPPHLVAALFVGRLDLPSAVAAGATYAGDPAVLKRLQPRAVPQAA
jgi:DNA-binding HxlR family transcriptional regulator